jgi:biopolymer transport protein ExbD
MAQIETSAIDRKGKSFSRNKKQVLKIDMTPMVDLGFLLITFFVFTTTMSTQKATDLFMPKDNSITDPVILPQSLALTLLLDRDDKIYYYHGDFRDASKTTEILQTNYSTYEGIGKIMRQKQKDIDTGGKFAEGRKAMMLLIKPTAKSNYKNVVDALDEAVINDVRKYAIIEPTYEELEFIKNKVNSRQ